MWEEFDTLMTRFSGLGTLAMAFGVLVAKFTDTTVLFISFSIALITFVIFNIKGKINVSRVDTYLSTKMEDALKIKEDAEWWTGYEDYLVDEFGPGYYSWEEVTCPKCHAVPTEHCRYPDGKENRHGCKERHDLFESTKE